MSSGEKRKLKGWIKLLIALAVIVVVLIGGYFGFNKIFNDPYKVYTGLVNEAFDSAVNFTKDFYDNQVVYSETSKFKMEYNFNFQSSLETLKDFANYKYGLKMAYDIKTNDMQVKLNVNNESKRIFDIGVMVSKDKNLIQSESLYNKTIDLGKNDDDQVYDDLTDMNNIFMDIPKYEEIKDSLNSLRNSIINTIDKKNIKSKYDKLEVDGEDITVIKYEYDFDKEVLNDFYNKVADDLLENYDFIKILSKLFNMEPKEVEDKIKDVKNTFTKADSFTITVYKKVFSSEIVKFTLLTADEEYVEYFQDVILYTYEKCSMRFFLDGFKDIKDKLRICSDLPRLFIFCM